MYDEHIVGSAFRYPYDERSDPEIIQEAILYDYLVIEDLSSRTPPPPGTPYHQWYTLDEEIAGYRESLLDYYQWLLAYEFQLDNLHHQWLLDYQPERNHPQPNQYRAAWLDFYHHRTDQSWALDTEVKDSKDNHGLRSITSLFTTGLQTQHLTCHCGQACQFSYPVHYSTTQIAEAFPHHNHGICTDCYSVVINQDGYEI